MKKLLLLITLWCCLAAAQAAPMKIAVVDADRIFKEYYKTKIVDAMLKQQMQIYKAWLKKLSKSQIKLQNEFKALRDEAQNIALDASARERKRVEALKKYRQLQEKKAEIEQYQREKMQQFKKLEAKKRHEILHNIRQAIASRAELEGYSLVLDHSGKTLNGISAVLFYKPNMDITDNIIKDLNRGRPAHNK